MRGERYNPAGIRGKIAGLHEVVIGIDDEVLAERSARGKPVPFEQGSQ